MKVRQDGIEPDCIGALALAVLALGQAQAQSPDIEFFEKKIRPVLAEKCYACHYSKAKSPWAAWRSTPAPALLKGGASGPGDQSRKAGREPAGRGAALHRRQSENAARRASCRTPPSPTSSNGSRWARPIPVRIRRRPLQGNRFRKGKEVVGLPAREAVRSAEGVHARSGRAARSTPSSWRSSTQNKLQPSAEADKRTLIRRASFDLTGLPPAYEEVEAFAADRAPDAYDR